LTHDQPAVELHDVAARVAGRTLWSGVSLLIPPTSFTAVVGPNGAGKTTLLRLLLGLTPPATGTIRVLGREPRSARRDVGHVTQRRALDRDIPVRGRDVVTLAADARWGILSRSRRRAAARRVDAVLEAVRASGYADHRIGVLSGGEQQRLFLAEALVGEPKLLLLDEPLASLDVRAQAEMARLVAGIVHERGIAAMMVTHDVNALIGLVDTVVYVARGQIVCGSPADVITGEVLSEVYDAPVDVLRDSRGRVFVVGLEDEVAHPHGR
jgi:zinc/manganese transport system ATP-binding protein